MNLKTSRIAMGWALAAVAACAVAAAQVGVSKLEWLEGPQQRGGTLILRFDAAVPRFEASARAWGIEIWLEGLSFDAVPFEGVRLSREQGGTRVRFERPGASLDSVRVEGDALMLRLGLGGAPAELGAQAGPGTEPAPRSAFAYHIGVGDLLSLTVYKNEDLSGDFTVGPDGTITLPLLGAVPAAGRTEALLAEELTRALEKDYLVDPKVAITVKTYQSQFVYVTGSISRASRVALQPNMTLKDVLSEAGVALVPGQEVVLNRTGSGGEKVHLGSADLESAGAPPPKDGDVLSIQEPLYVFMQGEVRRPGRLVLAKGMTLLQAISMSEGLSDWASKRDVRILRRSGDGSEEIEINLRKVETREVADPPLQANDVILVKRRIL